MAVVEQLDPHARAQRTWQEKAEADRRQREEQAEEHRLQEEIRAEGKAAELESLLGSVPTDMAIRIRLEAAIMVLGNAGALYGNLKQLQLDERAIELARYAITGKA